MKAVIFDLFGTLVHIEHSTHPYRRLLARAPTPGGHRLVMTSSASTAKLAKDLGIRLSADEFAELDAAIEQDVANIRVYPEVPRILSALRSTGHHILVSSNLAKPYGHAKALLEELVDYWNFSYDTGMLKPDPQMFLGPIEAFGLTAEQCVVVGDSLASDAAGASAAGIPFVLLDRSGKASGQEFAANLVEALPLILEALPKSAAKG